MENPLLEEKRDLIKWISNLDDLDVLSELMALKENSQLSIVAEPAAEYNVADDFDKKFAAGLSSEQARKQSKRLVREWWGK